MISVQEAESIIHQQYFHTTSEIIDVHRSEGRILAEDIIADRDFPPFTRVSMDGIAILSATWKAGRREFAIEGVQAAGNPPLRLLNPFHCIEVMTGAMLPDGTDTVVRYEDIDIKEGKATILIDGIDSRQNIHPQRQDCTKGERILVPGQKISPAEVALMASVGKRFIQVLQVPPVAIISTGNELVDIDQQPQPWQIRRSNGYAIQAALHSMKIPAQLFHLPDDAAILPDGLKKILDQCEILILSGGVSKGKFDFIPSALQQAGIEKKFHQVSQKPGKPFWFGRSGRHTVFALPGNPVSTFLCFYKYIQPWIEKGLKNTPGQIHAILAEDFVFKPRLTYFLQVKISFGNGKILAHPQAGGGSGDFANLKQVDGFLELPADQEFFKAGEVFPYLPFRT